MEARQRRRGATTAAEATRATATRSGTRMGTVMATKRRLVPTQETKGQRGHTHTHTRTHTIRQKRQADARGGFLALRVWVFSPLTWHPFVMENRCMPERTHHRN